MADTPQRHILPAQPATNETRSNQLANRLESGNDDPLSLQRILAQALHDLYGTKDVQDAITASYVWLADQIGHLALGLLPTLLLCWIFDALWSNWLCPACGTQSIVRVLSLAAIGFAFFSYWIKKELDDYHDSYGRRGGQFPFDSSDVWWNVKTALFYLGIGGLFGVAAFVGPWWLVGSVLLALWPAFRIAIWWLRRKVAFQQAGLPYLYRLANFSRVLGIPELAAATGIANLKNHDVKFLTVCFGTDPVMDLNPQVRHILLTGPLGSGKTSLAVGIGTEFAFALGVGRYMTASKLVQAVADARSSAHRMDYDDGLILWPWLGSDLLIVDDLDTGVAEPGKGALHLVQPGTFAAALTLERPDPLAWLATKRSVWIIGDKTLAAAWIAAIATLMHVEEKEIMQIDLSADPAPKPPAEPPPRINLRKTAGYATAALGLVLLLVSALWWNGEARWGRFETMTPEQAFADGSFGLELAPLKYILVAGKLSGPAFEVPGGPHWPQRFGFLARKNAAARTCVADAPSNLPVGFSVSNRLPGSATPVPVQFVGLTCAACHSARLGQAGVVLGPGSQTADVIGFTDAFLGAALDTGKDKNAAGLDGDAILAAYDAQRCPGEPTGIAHWLDNKIEGFFIDRWLSGLRSTSRLNISKYDVPFHGTQIGDPANIPTGPSRTRPFRSVVRNTLDFPGAANRAYSHVPAAILQGEKPWSQFDGSVGDPVVRSMIAIFTSGASVPALNEPQIAYNIRQAAAYTLNLGRDPALPSLRQAYPQVPAPPPATLARGEALYMQHCDSCHGHPAGAGWRMPQSVPSPYITPLAAIGTDRSRIEFRYSDMLPAALETLLPARDIDAQTALIDAERARAYQNGDFAIADWWSRSEQRLADSAREFPAGHALNFGLQEVKFRDGFLNSPIEFAWLRAPLLHNGSVLSLAALIGLVPRQTQFCRGDAGYDTAELGLATVLPVNGKCPANAPFLFDATQPGNSNAGHVYPAPGAVSDDDLKALLAYLGTL